MLWEEYREVHPEGYAYSRFCDLFREFERRLSPVMRQHHAAGDKVFVDYSGKKVPIVDPATGLVREAEIFVAVLGASSLTYAEATWSQTLPDWIGAHGRLFRYPGRRASPGRAGQPEERDPLKSCENRHPGTCPPNFCEGQGSTPGASKIRSDKPTYHT